MQKILAIDSHTGGEPTRVVVQGAPDLGSGDVLQRRDLLRDKHDWFRRATVCEPRGSDEVVGALLGESSREDCIASVIFFNNVGLLGMCVHGTVGLGVTLGHMGRIEPDRDYLLETVVGVVSLRWESTNHVTVRNVESYRTAVQVPLELPDGRLVHGDIAWGGNWFFLVNDHGQEIVYENRKQLMQFAQTIRDTLDAQGVTGENDGLIDHIELFAPPLADQADSKNFVLCPGGAYDRSPCGTGTSAKLACLYDDGKLAPGDVWRQEGIVGSVFEGSIEPAERGVIPTIRGTAFISAETQLLLDPRDPFRAGIG